MAKTKLHGLVDRLPEGRSMVAPDERTKPLDAPSGP
jgi:hypothetical protein